jgi:hydroxyethylthiazole kinase-like uncharacterized protein yjeF
MAATHHPLFGSTALRALEHAALAALPPHTLMPRAAQAACNLILQRWRGRPVVILCGPGNNGGDGLVLARLLNHASVPVRVWALPMAKRPADAERAWRDLPRGLLKEGDPTGDVAGSVIVDALFGIGMRRAPDPDTRRWLDWAQAQEGAIRLALDVPTGLDADTGEAHDGAMVADVTLTFLRDKPGLHTRAGQDHAGEVVVDTLGTDTMSVPLPTDDASIGIGRLIRRGDCEALFSPRKHDTHKGSFGTLAVLGGGHGMTGAALLASRAALHLGAGKVFVGLAEANPALTCDLMQPELMLRPAAGLLGKKDAGIGVWVVGCGLGTDQGAADWLAATLHAARELPTVVDADALLLMAANPKRIPARKAPWVLTPHPREAAQLLGCDTAAVQADRVAQARRLARKFSAWVVLKGAGTVVSSPDGQWSVNDSGNAGLATAGTGDVLAGMIGALLAQGLGMDDAARSGVWLHGAAAQDLSARGMGPTGLTASEVILAARDLRNRPGT